MEVTIMWKTIINKDKKRYRAAFMRTNVATKRYKAVFMRNSDNYMKNKVIVMYSHIHEK